MTTITFSFTSATFSIKSFPLCKTSKSALSPIEFSTTKYSSPDVEATKITHKSAFLAALIPPSISSVALT